MKLLCIGEVMAELRREQSGDWAVGFAGDTFNTAVYCARRMGSANAVGYMTRVGTDPLSDDLVAFAKAEGLPDALIARDPSRQIGIYSVSTDPAGERSFHYWRNASAARAMFDGEVALPAAEVIYLSGISLAILPPEARDRLIAALTVLRASGKSQVAFDSNYRPRLWEDVATARRVMTAMWKITDIAMPSIDDEMALHGDATEEAVIARFAAGRWRGCAIKRGARGPIDPALPPTDLPQFAPATRLVDTTAAGDSFNAGYLAAYLTGASSADRLLAGHDLASRVVGVRGAIAPRGQID